MMEYQFFISPEAAQQIKIQLNKRHTPSSFIRIGITGGSCSGYAYNFQFEDAPPKVKDLIFEVDGVKVVIDSKSILYLNGATLNWEESLLRQGFKFSNPNVQSNCGCGESFSVK